MCVCVCVWVGVWVCVCVCVCGGGICAPMSLRLRVTTRPCHACGIRKCTHRAREVHAQQELTWMARESSCISVSVLYRTVSVLYLDGEGQ